MASTDRVGPSSDAERRAVRSSRGARVGVLVGRHIRLIAEARERAFLALQEFEDRLAVADLEVPEDMQPPLWRQWSAASLVAEFEALQTITAEHEDNSRRSRPPKEALHGEGDEGSAEAPRSDEDTSDSYHDDSSGTYRADSVIDSEESSGSYGGDGDGDDNEDDNEDDANFVDGNHQHAPVAQDPTSGGGQRDGVPPPIPACEGAGPRLHAPLVDLEQSFDVSDMERLSGGDDDGDELEYVALYV